MSTNTNVVTHLLLMEELDREHVDLVIRESIKVFIVRHMSGIKQDDDQMKKLISNTVARLLSFKNNKEFHEACAYYNEQYERIALSPKYKELLTILPVKGTSDDLDFSADFKEDLKGNLLIILNYVNQTTH